MIGFMSRKAEKECEIRAFEGFLGRNVQSSVDFRDVGTRIGKIRVSQGMDSISEVCLVERSSIEAAVAAGGGDAVMVSVYGQSNGFGRDFVPSASLAAWTGEWGQIGNPLLKLDNDTAATYEYFCSHGMISDEIFLAITNECDFDDYSDECNKALEEANNIVGDYINDYDVILDVCYPSIVEQELRLRKSATKISIEVDVCMTYERHFYFNLPAVQWALHANRTHLPYSWSMCSGGDQDSVVPLLGSRTLIRELANDLKFKVTVPYGAWFSKGQDPRQLKTELE